MLSGDLNAGGPIQSHPDEASLRVVRCARRTDRPGRSGKGCDARHLGRDASEGRSTILQGRTHHVSCHTRRTRVCPQGPRRRRKSWREGRRRGEMPPTCASCEPCRSQTSVPARSGVVMDVVKRGIAMADSLAITAGPRMQGPQCLACGRERHEPVIGRTPGISGIPADGHARPFREDQPPPRIRFTAMTVDLTVNGEFSRPPSGGLPGPAPRNRSSGDRDCPGRSRPGYTNAVAWR